MAEHSIVVQVALASRSPARTAPAGRVRIGAPRTSRYCFAAAHGWANQTWLGSGMAQLGEPGMRPSVYVLKLRSATQPTFGTWSNMTWPFCVVLTAWQSIGNQLSFSTRA